jgi:hypothetical protein
MFYGVKYLFKQSELCCVCYELHMFCGGGQKSLSTVSILNTGNLFWTITSGMYAVDRLSLPSPWAREQL